MLAEKITFTEDFRCFPKGTQIEFKSRVTVIVGDNGAGKSSLIGSLRGHFETSWSMSQIHRPLEALPSTITPNVPGGTEMNYIDLATDLMKSSGHMHDDHMDLHLSLLHKSSGQSSILQLSGMMEASQAKIHIIDEPERGLSPAKLPVMATLLQETIADRPDDQFIIITHSPIIMNALAEEVLFMPSGTYTTPDHYMKLAAADGYSKSKMYASARRSQRLAKDLQEME